MGSSDKKGTMKHLNFLLAFMNAIKKLLRKINVRMENKYSTSFLALAVTLVAALVTANILFLPNYLGVAGDGSTDDIMNAAGIYYIGDDSDDNYNNYFLKTYSRIAAGGQEPSNTFNSQVFIIKIAAVIDDVVTRDNYFDIRFLGLLYTIMFLPAVYLFIKQVCNRVKRFSEIIVIAAAGLLIFSDVGYVTYFNSFYPEAIWFITMLYCAAFAMSFQKNQSCGRDLLNLALFIGAAVILTSTRRQCAVLGFIFSVYCIRLIFIRRNWIWGASCAAGAFALSILSVACLLSYKPDFSEISKFHAMTRGVLFESVNPADTLAEFGIDPSYELLADASAYDYLPLVKAGDDSLYQGFLDKYTIEDITVYYLQHPGSLLGMLDVSISSGMNLRRSNCGNYEKSVGLPKMARSLFWSAWSTFKLTSAPRTIGYLFILTAGIVLLFYKGYSIRPVEDRRSTVFLDMLLMVLAVLLIQAVTVILNSGDAEMIQRTFLVGFGLDIMTYCVFAELLHKINIV